MSKLSQKQCIPCEGGVPALSTLEQDKLLKQLKAWEVVRAHHLTKTYPFPDFLTALDFTNRIGVLAEKQGHHPDIYLSWGKVKLEIWTHAVDGLTDNDFILAAKIDDL